jgi:hypothetical protein
LRLTSTPREKVCRQLRNQIENVLEYIDLICARTSPAKAQSIPVRPTVRAKRMSIRLSRARTAGQEGSEFSETIQSRQCARLLVLA